MSRWFRFYDDALDDPKVQLLSDKLHRGWVNLLCLASKHDGVLPPLPDIAFRLRKSESETSSLLDTLYAKGLLDEIELDDAPMSYSPHNWSGRQYKSDTSNERVKQHRKRKCNVTPAVTVTPPETEQIQITETEQKDCADAPIDPSKAEREFFARGREVLGKSAGGQLAKLLKANGGNVSLSRSTLELAATKHNPTEFFARAVAPSAQGPPPGKGGFTSVLMDKHMERQNGTSDS